MIHLKITILLILFTSTLSVSQSKKVENTDKSQAKAPEIQVEDATQIDTSATLPHN